MRSYDKHLWKNNYQLKKLKKYERELLNMENVTGTGIEEEGGKPVIKVYVIKKQNL
ncbi:MAG: hypothetical protein AB1297_08910 [bacterium]